MSAIKQRIELSPEEDALMATLAGEYAKEIAKMRFPGREPGTEELDAISHEVRDHLTAFITGLDQAREADAHVVMEGDWGGQVYLSVPARQVACGEQTLRKLLEEIDAREWGCNEGDGAGVRYQKAVKEIGISGGMGGGEITDGLWVHGTLEGLKPQIQEVLEGKRDSIKT